MFLGFVQEISREIDSNLHSLSPVTQADGATFNKSTFKMSGANEEIERKIAKESEILQKEQD